MSEGLGCHFGLANATCQFCMLTCAFLLWGFGTFIQDLNNFQFSIMDLQLQDKTAFISGSTKGIGFAIAKRFVLEGANVIINGRDDASIAEAITKLQKVSNEVRITGIAADFSKVAEVDQLLKELPPIDILINNVGIFEPKPFAEIPDADWFRFFEINVMSGVRMSRALFPKMLEKNWGRIIFIASESGVVIPSEMIHYGMTKSAQIAIARGMAELTKGTQVTVNTVMPGPTRSEGVETFIGDMARSKDISFDQMEDEFFASARPTSLLQRFISVDEIANTVVYYSSPLAAATNGASIRAEGGLVHSAF